MKLAASRFQHIGHVADVGVCMCIEVALTVFLAMVQRHGLDASGNRTLGCHARRAGQILELVQQGQALPTQPSPAPTGELLRRSQISATLAGLDTHQRSC